jgi:RNA polymerase sigma-70 factor (ECF subfamily)
VEDFESLWRQWMIAGLAGDARAYRRLLDALTPRLRGFVARHLASDYAADIEDIVQETLIAIHTQRSRYEPSRPIAPWLFAIARYKLVDHCRRAGRRGASIPVDAVEDLLVAPLPEDALNTAEISPLLEELPAKQRTAIDLVKLQAMSVRDAAKASGMSEAAIRVNVHRGIKTLAEIIANRVRP